MIRVAHIIQGLMEFIIIFFLIGIFFYAIAYDDLPERHQKSFFLFAFMVFFWWFVVPKAIIEAMRETKARPKKENK